MPEPDRWDAPPQPLRQDGQTRRVGVEIEFAELPVPQAAAVVAATLGGVLTAEGPQRLRVTGGDLGDFTVELDMRYAHSQRETGIGRVIRDALAEASALIVPVEIVCPPIPWDRAHALDRLLAALRRAGAKGARAGILYAFGLQLNIEAQSTRPEALLSLMRAYALLHDWLAADVAIDGARALLGFAAPFHDDYVARLLDPRYTPDLAALIDDYIAFNPSRDRALDCLPLMAHLDHARVRAALPDEKINARPAWHYRLPNSEIDDPGWSVGLEWRRWLRVERLASDRALSEQAARDWFQSPRTIGTARWREGAARLAARLADA
ncbi:MAG: amidoligase family protein [Rubrimonas sp.]